jgi:hypothetical protein
VGHLPGVFVKHLAPIMDKYNVADFRLEGVVPSA